MDEHTPLPPLELTDLDGPTVQELLTHVVRQAITDYHDYVPLKELPPEAKKTPRQQARIVNGIDAEAFLFDDTHVIDWGGADLSFRDICDHLNTDVTKLRASIRDGSVRMVAKNRESAIRRKKKLAALKAERSAAKKDP